ncbi:hypothetical protein [Conexibacter sp. CPCC 206217]|uniref:TolB family protein n=1 Tax=Conexibacter sp. CPCC 206217 TaxID=3064574 RepID=UPI002720E092|nr:hypothetical protein [Conexibacter sp. CPCC 206217]MDO8209323.1 hypothetical protein [Conexibacter sp. CPCC 206217]
MRLVRTAATVVASAGVATVLATTFATTSADAAFSPPQMISGNTAMAADTALDPVFAAAGRYVAFTGSQSGTTGIFRKDLATGALELVAGGDATSPSISADGRYVSFTTSADLDPADSSGDCTSVYVRDMSASTASSAAYTLVSARDGATDSLSYADSATPGCPGGGADATRGALSADGHRVAFTVIGSSDLEGGPGETTTPPLQVAMRALDTDSTMLVSQTRESLGSTPAPVPGAAALAIAPQQGSPGARTSRSTATISADGSTVAWMGAQIPAQAAVDLARLPRPQPDWSPTWYAEPLWRRIADGPAAPTRRILGGDDDPEACPTCSGPLVASYTSQSSIAERSPTPVFGSFVVNGIATASFPFRSSFDAITPRMSADGRTVALLSTQPTPPEAAILASSPTRGLTTANAFVVDMTPGLTRQQAVRQLTAWPSFDFGTLARTGDVTEIAISPDGSRVALTTPRIVFSLSPPALVSAPLGQVVATELYQVNLGASTLSLASIGYDGRAADGDVFGLSYGGDSRTIAFASAAANLVYGAVNGSDAIFAMRELEVPSVPGQPTETPRPISPEPTPRWRISATARRTRDGRVLLDVAVPASGRLAVVASANVAVAAPRPKRSASRRRTSSRRGARRPAARSRTAARQRRTRIVRRTVAQAKTTTGSAGVVHLKLTTPQRYRALARARAGLDATLAIAFTAAGRPALRITLQTRFRVVPKRPARSLRTPPPRPSPRRTAQG